MSRFATVIDILEAARTAVPNAVKRTGHLYLCKRCRGRKPTPWQEAIEALEDAGWRDNGFLAWPPKVRARCEAHPDWELFIETMPKHELVGDASLGFFCTVYIWAHERNLL